jgi:Putative addiction module component.
MSFAQVLEELPALSSEQRRQILERIIELDRGGWLDIDDPLSEVDKQIIESRLAKHEADPTSAISLEELENRLGQRSRK